MILSLGRAERAQDRSKGFRPRKLGGRPCPQGRRLFSAGNHSKRPFLGAGTARSVHGNRSKCEVRRSGPSTRTRQRSLAMVKAKPKVYEDYKSPGGTEWRLRLAPGSASGYYGVIKNKGKWQGMGYDPNKQTRRSLPGLFEKPQGAAALVAKFDARFRLGAEKIPSPMKHATRGTGVLLLVACTSLIARVLCVDVVDRSLSIMPQVSSRRRSRRRSMRESTTSSSPRRSQPPRPSMLCSRWAHRCHLCGPHHTCL